MGRDLRVMNKAVTRKTRAERTLSQREWAALYAKVGLIGRGCEGHLVQGDEVVAAAGGGTRVIRGVCV